MNHFWVQDKHEPTIVALSAKSTTPPVQQRCPSQGRREIIPSPIQLIASPTIFQNTFACLGGKHCQTADPIKQLFVSPLTWSHSCDFEYETQTDNSEDQVLTDKWIATNGSMLRGAAVLKCSRRASGVFAGKSQFAGFSRTRSRTLQERRRRLYCGSEEQNYTLYRCSVWKRRYLVLDS